MGHIGTSTREKKPQRGAEMIYTSNPVVFGMPNQTVEFEGIELNTEELLGVAEDSPGTVIEVDLNTGEWAVVDKQS